MKILREDMRDIAHGNAAPEVIACSIICADKIPLIIQKKQPRQKMEDQTISVPGLCRSVQKRPADKRSANLTGIYLKILVSVFLTEFFVEDPVSSIACHQKDLEDLAGADKFFVDQGLLSLEIADELNEFLAVAVGF